MVKYQLWILLTIFLFFYSIATLSAIRHPVLINDRYNIDSLCTYSSPNHLVYKDFVDFACTYPYYSHLQPWFSWTFNKPTYLQVISHPNFCWSQPGFPSHRSFPNRSYKAEQRLLFSLDRSILNLYLPALSYPFPKSFIFCRSVQLTFPFT